MAAMTTGALILLAFEGKPIKPMAFSLSSQTPLKSVHSVLGTQAGIELGHWQQIEVSYESNQGRLSAGNGPTGSLTMAYHFIISNHATGMDGQIFATYRWARQLECINLKNSSNFPRIIRICLIVEPDDDLITPQQSRQIEKLVSSLKKYCQISSPVVWK